MSSTPVLPAPDAPPLAQGLSRRTVVGAGLWSAPVLAMASSAPAFAAASGQQALTLSVPTSGIPSSGPVQLTTVVRDAQGAPVAGAPVSLSGPLGSTFGGADGVTDGAGAYTTSFDLGKPWATPGSTISITAVSGGQSASQPFTVLGSNVLAFGRNVWAELGLGAAASSPTQTYRAFPSPVVQIASGGATDSGAARATLALLRDGTVWGIGGNAYGQLGDGTGDSTGHDVWKIVPGLSGVKQIGMGNVNGYALTTAGEVWAWGDNSSGQIGDGTTTYRTAPVKVISSGATKLVAGYSNVFVVMSDRTLKVWGDNGWGQLGDGTQTNRTTPFTVPNVSDVVDVASISYASTLVLLSNGTVLSWGLNNLGQLGNGTKTNSATPTAIPNLSGVAAIAGGSTAGYALLTDGSVKAWGNNDEGMVGDGTSTMRLTPTTVSGLSGVVQISTAQKAAYALLSDGTVKAWGQNTYGQLGDGTTTTRLSPVTVQVPAGRSVTSLAVASTSSQGRSFLITGETTLSVDVVETQVSAGTAATVKAKVATGAKGVAGISVTLSATSNAALGATTAQTDSSGQVQTTVTSDVWTKPGTVVRVEATTDTNAASDSFTVLGANALGFGYNSWYELGDGGQGGGDNPGTGVARTIPTQFLRSFPSPIVQVVSCGTGTGGGSNHATIVLLKDGTVWSVGGNGFGQLGTGGNSRTTWAQVSGLSGVTQISAGAESVYALLSDGTVKAWGDNWFGEIGTGVALQSAAFTPITVPGVSGVTQIAAGTQQAFFLLSDGTVRAIGRNAWGSEATPGGRGALGSGSTTSDLSATPVTVSNLAGVTQIAAGSASGFALLSDGTVKAWGNNASGQLGNNSTTSSAVPVSVSGLSGVTQVVANLDAAYALLADKTIRAWGRNSSGQLGNGSGSNSTAPVTVTSVTGAARLAASGNAAYALLGTGAIVGWGDNSGGQLADGSTTNRSQAVQVRVPGSLNVVGLASFSPSSDRMYVITGDTTVSVDVVESQLAAAMGSATVKARVGAGSKAAMGATVSLSVSSGATLGATSGQTDGNGEYLTTVSVPDAWTRPGTIVRVSASSGPSTGSDTFTVLGANALGFGYNSWYEMGDDGAPGGDNQGTGSLRSTPSQFVRVFPSPIAQVVSCGVGDGGGSNQTTIVLLKDGTVWSVGGNGFGQLGTTGNSRSRWAQVTGLAGVTQLSAGNYHVYALLADGTVKAWGDNSSGMLGAAVSADASSTPVTVTGLSNVVQISAGTQQGFFLLKDGTVRAIGRNTFSAALGNGSSVEKSATPVTVSNLSGVTQIAGGHQCGYALKSDGTVWAWGANDLGRLGDGTNPVPGPWVSGQATPAHSTPVQVAGLSGVRVTQVAGNRAGGVVLLSDGSVRAWGDNTAGAVGDGTTTSRSSATPVSNLAGGVAKIAASGSSAYVLRTDNSVNAWGDNQYGQLGVGTTTNALVPVTVGNRPNGTRAWGQQTPVDLMQNSPSSSRMYIITQ
ncbi:hypothetical protein RWH44_01005 [Microbacterium sp. KSW2-29]|uniref:Big-1 domain-containing protein n=1 Tax=Microbacterium phycohabitans TaxID=3075993 RepID=A0ABU3SHK4_9MICO|nr:hypothetical protein [Microbacterium sp. KSW2-29]MDU0344267.1 hypothetical protein [Microbacterium sp. KSW2-29]